LIANNKIGVFQIIYKYDIIGGIGYRYGVGSIDLKSTFHLFNLDKDNCNNEEKVIL
jgi:hypothetical protein